VAITSAIVTLKLLKFLHAGSILEHFRAFGSILEAFGRIRKHPKHLPFTTRITSFFENLKSEPDMKYCAPLTFRTAKAHAGPRFGRVVDFTDIFASVSQSVRFNLPNA
jgi:hypothetical protein